MWSGGGGLGGGGSGARSSRAGGTGNVLGWVGRWGSQTDRLLV